MNLDPQKVDLTNQNQKIFAGLLVGGTLILLYFLLPPLIVIFANLWLLAILAIPVIFIVLNPMLVWNIYKQLSWNLTKKLISGDKLGYMYRYHDYLLSKIESLNQSINNVTQMRVKLQRKIGELQDRIENSKAQANEYQKKEVSKLVISSLATKIDIDTKQLAILLPRAVDIEKQEKYLKELSENMSADAEQLKYTLDAKAEEYKLLKELSEASGTASEFLKGNSEEYKLYQESLNQIENSVTQYTANVENFERKVRPILDTMSAERSVSEQNGLKLIEEFKQKTADISFKQEE